MATLVNNEDWNQPPNWSMPSIYKSAFWFSAMKILIKNININITYFFTGTTDYCAILVGVTFHNLKDKTYNKYHVKEKVPVLDVFWTNECTDFHKILKEKTNNNTMFLCLLWIILIILLNYGIFYQTATVSL